MSFDFDIIGPEDVLNDRRFQLKVHEQNVLYWVQTINKRLAEEVVEDGCCFSLVVHHNFEENYALDIARDIIELYGKKWESVSFTYKTFGWFRTLKDFDEGKGKVIFTFLKKSV